MRELTEAIPRLKMDAAAATQQTEALTTLIATLTQQATSEKVDVARQRELEAAVARDEKVCSGCVYCESDVACV